MVGHAAGGEGHLAREVASNLDCNAAVCVLIVPNAVPEADASAAFQCVVVQ